METEVIFLSNSNPKYLTSLIKEKISEGFRITPGTIFAVYEPIATGSNYQTVRSTDGFFACEMYREIQKKQDS